MSSWEEVYVDREIDEAWRSFRRQVTAALEDDESAEIDWLFVAETATVDDEVAFGACLSRDDVWFTVGRIWTFPTPEFSRREIDRAVARLIDVLRNDCGVLHPSFLQWEADSGTDAERLLDLDLTSRAPAPEPSVGVRSEVWSSLDPQMLVENVDVVLGDLFGHPPYKADDGEIFVQGQRGGLCMIGVRNFDIEVWTTIALGVEDEASRAGALEMLPKLTTDHPRYRFVLTDGMLVASTVVDGVTFVPDQLRRAMEATLQLHRDYDGLSDFLIELAHPQPGCQPGDDSVAGPGTQGTLF